MKLDFPECFDCITAQCIKGIIDGLSLLPADKLKCVVWVGVRMGDSGTKISVTIKVSQESRFESEPASHCRSAVFNVDGVFVSAFDSAKLQTRTEVLRALEQLNQVSSS